MDLTKALLKEHSKTQTDKIVRYVSNDQERFDELMKIFLSDNYLLGQRSGWPLSYCAEKNPEWVKPHIRKMILNLKNPVHEAVFRNTMRMLQFVEVPKSLHGLVADTCFKLLEASSTSVAVKAFSMTVLLNIVRVEKELKNELRILIEDQMPYSSAGFVSRGKKVLKALDSI